MRILYARRSFRRFLLERDFVSHSMRLIRARFIRTSMFFFCVRFVYFILKKKIDSIQVSTRFEINVSCRMATEMMTIESYRSNVSHWNIDNGYDEGINNGNYPFRMYNAKKGAGLSVALALFERDLEYICRGPIQGFKLILSTPGDVIQMTRQFFRVPLAEMVEISIRPKLITTSDDLRTYSSDQRKCFFSTERSLRFFQFYTEINCEAECLANFTIIECGCVKFSMPSK